MPQSVRGWDHWGYFRDSAADEEGWLKRWKKSVANILNNSGKTHGIKAARSITLRLEEVSPPRVMISITIVNWTEAKNVIEFYVNELVRQMYFCGVSGRIKLVFRNELVASVMLREDRNQIVTSYLVRKFPRPRYNEFCDYDAWGRAAEPVESGAFFSRIEAAMSSHTSTVRYPQHLRLVTVLALGIFGVGFIACMALFFVEPRSNLLISVPPLLLAIASLLVYIVGENAHMMGSITPPQ